MSSPVPLYGVGKLPEGLAGAGLLIDKPKGWTSFDVIRVLRQMLPICKIGHAGTLDPAATGLLICLVGRSATRHMEAFMQMPKRYEGVMQLGAVTSSWDADTPVTKRQPWEHLAAEDLEHARKQLIGVIQQQPPMYSAVKVGGERLYQKARRGEVVNRKSNEVTVHAFNIVVWQGADIHFMIRCSKGTYIRAIARDMGRALGVGAHLTALRRTEIGRYRVDEAWTMGRLAMALEGQPAG